MNEKATNVLIPQPFVQNIGDAELASLRYEGEGPPLIFLHATGFLPWLWHPVARELAGDYRIFAPYFCDHRDADPENGGVNWRTLAEDLALFCERLHLEKPFLVGGAGHLIPMEQPREATRLIREFFGSLRSREK
jgi:pimeloyl-ACP methyl ester carboxylesterase